MTMVTCPDCRTQVDIDSARSFAFCFNCGRKLYLESSQTVAPSELSGVSGSFESRPVRVRVVMPQSPAKIPGSFNYFGTKWDGRDLQSKGCNEVMVIDTMSGSHTVEVRQVNGGIFGAKIIKVSGTFNISCDSQIDVVQDDKQLTMRLLGGGLSYSDSYSSSESGPKSGLSFR